MGRSAVAGTSVEISRGMIDCFWWRGFVGESPSRSRNSGQGKRMMASPCLLPQGGKLSSGFKCSACSFQQRCLLRIKSRISLVRRQSRASRRYPFPGLYSHHHCGYSLQISLLLGLEIGVRHIVPQELRVKEALPQSRKDCSKMALLWRKPSSGS